MGIVFLVLVLVSLILFIFLIVKTASAWGGLQTTMLFFIYFATVVFLFSAAGVARLRIGWVKSFYGYEKIVNKLTEEETKLKYGDLNSTANDEQSLNSLMGRLADLTADRGRVWRDATAQMQGPEFLIEIPQQKPQVGEQPAAPVEGEEGALPANLVVHAFHLNTNEQRAIYLGEFLVASSTGSKATLRPTATLPKSASNFLQSNGDKLWTIFELMPSDSHEVFAASGSKPTDDEVFGRMDTAVIASLLGVDPAIMEQTLAPNDPNFSKAELLRSYVRDGKEAPADVLPANDWYLVEFLQPYEVEVDSPEDRSPTDGGFFDLSGRTVDARLKRGKDQSKVKFIAGDRTLLTRRGAENEQLVEKKIIKFVKRVYVRTLNSYEFAFRDTRKRTVSTIQQMDYIKRETGIVIQANKIGQQQIALRQTHRQNLDQDFAQVQKEVDVSGGEIDRLEKELAGIETKIRDSYQSMQKLHKVIRTQQLGVNAN